MRPIVALLLAVCCGTAASADEDVHPFDGLQVLAKSLRPHVERSVGARFVKPPVVVELTPAAGLAAARADLRPEIVKKYPGLSEGQIRTRVDALAAASLTSSLARYSFALRSVTVVRTSFDRQRRLLGISADDARHVLAAALAHELVHAMDDQRFGLAARKGKTGGAEARRALNMVIEGRAVHYGRGAARAAGVPERAITGIGGSTPRSVFLRLTYETGAEFIGALEARGGRALADRALTDPPVETHFIFHAGRWPDGKVDARPGRILAGAFPDVRAEPLSELELRARYTALDGAAAAGSLFAGYRGGVKAFVDGTNAVVFAFADEDAAKRFASRSQRDAPTERHGAIVLKASGENAKTVLQKLRSAIKPGKAR